MGEGESVSTERPFHIMKAVERIRAKLRIWEAAWRGEELEREENMVVGWRWSDRWMILLVALVEVRG